MDEFNKVLEIEHQIKKHEHKKLEKDKLKYKEK